MMHAFVDESYRSTYTIIVTLTAGAETARTRPKVRALLLSGQERVHFHRESDGRRRHILSAIADLPTTTWIFDAKANRKEQENARARCFAELIRHMEELRVQRLVL